MKSFLTPVNLGDQTKEFLNRKGNYGVNEIFCVCLMSKVKVTRWVPVNKISVTLILLKYELVLFCRIVDNSSK